MKSVSYTSLQKLYSGKLVAISQKNGKVLAAQDTSQKLEKLLKEKGIDPKNCVFLGPIEPYKQISVY